MPSLISLNWVEILMHSLEPGPNKSGGPTWPVTKYLKLFVAFLGINQFRRVGLRFVGTPKGYPKVVLWRSRGSNLRPLVYKE